MLLATSLYICQFNVQYGTIVLILCLAPRVKTWGRCGNGRFATLYQFLYIYSMDAYCTFSCCCVHMQYGTDDAEL